MGVHISGIVIDQTRTDGKWYVRELRDKNGDVTPVFFRREKGDLLGRLIDKFRHVESAQRYAASHLDALGFQHHVDLGDVYATEGVLRSSVNERDKLLSTSLQALLDEKVKQSDIMPSARTDDREITEAACHVTVIRHQSDLNQDLSHLWEGFREHVGAQNKNDKKAFFKEMGDALRLWRGDMVSNDPRVWETCRKLVEHISLRADGRGLQESSKATWEALRDFFAPAASAPAPEHAQRLDADHAFYIASKASLLQEELWSARPASSSMSQQEFKQALQQIFRIYLEETSTKKAVEAVSGLLPPIDVALDGAELSRLLLLAQEMLNHASPALSPGTRDFLQGATDAVSHRLHQLQKVQEAGKTKTPGLRSGGGSIQR